MVRSPAQTSRAPRLPWWEGEHLDLVIAHHAIHDAGGKGEPGRAPEKRISVGLDCAVVCRALRLRA